MSSIEALKDLENRIKNIKNFAILNELDFDNIVKNIKNKKIVKNKGDNAI